MIKHDPKCEPQLSLLGILMMFSFLFMSADCKIGCFRTVRADLEHYFLPLQKAVNGPIQLAFSNAEEMDSFFKKQTTLIAEIKQLKQKNEYLLAENQKTRSLENENQQLQALLNVSKARKEKLLLVNLLQISADPFSHYIMLDKGKNEGIIENQAIIDTQGVVGSVNSVNRLSSKVRLITDKAHAVPVQNSRNGLRGIASGTGKWDTLLLLHAPLSADYQVGDVLLTSGLGGRFPAGYPVGIVTQVSHLKGQAFARITVKPMADFSKMNHVLVVTDKLIDIQSSLEANNGVSNSIESSLSHTQALDLIPPERAPMISKKPKTNPGESNLSEEDDGFIE